MRISSKLLCASVVASLLFGLVGRSVLAAPAHPGADSWDEIRPLPDAGADDDQPDEIRLHARRLSPSAGIEATLQGALAAAPGKIGGRAHVLLQLRSIPDEAARAALRRAGVRLLHYIPRNGWFASLPAERVQERLARPDVARIVRWAGQILPADKVDAGVRLGRFGEWALVGDGLVRLAVSFYDDVTPGAARAVVVAHGGLVEAEIATLDQLEIVLPVDNLRALVDEDTVRWVDQIHPPFTTANDDARRAARVDDVQAAPYELFGAGIVVGIWDGGAVDAAHDDFADQDGVSRVTLGDSAGPSSHSTHVAGTFGGNGARSATLGGTYRQWRGMAPRADVVSYDFNGDLDEEHEEAVVVHDIDLSQNSWGWGVDDSNCDDFGTYVSHAALFDEIVRGAHGRAISAVFAVGNDREDDECGHAPGPDYLNYATTLPPSTAKNVVTVGATNSNDHSMTIFSGWGPTDDGRLKPEVVAPGCERDRDRDDADYTRTVWSARPGNDYWGGCGTSMAAPVVSGIAALLYEEYDRTFSAAPQPSTIKALLVHGARDLDNGTSWYNPGPDYASGYGVVDAKASADLIIARALREGVVNVNAQRDVYTVTVPPESGSLKVTLAWDDPAATENAEATLVNDLDLYLVDPAAGVFRPWILDPTSPDAAALRGIDRANNLEQVLVATPAAGQWRIVVDAYGVPEAPQPYSLVSEALAYKSVYLPLVLRSAGPGNANRPPDVPGSPGPADGSVDRSVDVDLS